MLDFPIVPPIELKDRPKSRRVTSLNEARVLVDDLLRERRFDKWRDMLARLDAVRTEEDAVEAIGALRELLAMEALLTS
ncbi:MAG TPA: hypothetical protein VHG27_09080 [Xanthobacteraceae bacterium]|nr:hypothetical protein [Xanthobacteraceae bacterium]